MSSLTSKLADIHLYLVVNGLTVTTLEKFISESRSRLDGKVSYIIDKERSVAASWNEGIIEAIKGKNQLLMIMANDIILDQTTVDRLIDFGLDHKSHNTAVWSAVEKKHNPRSGFIDWDACDFSCFMLRPATLVRFGQFDENFKPAYFEDNDYYARVVLGGGDIAAIHDANHFHYGSMTTRTDNNLRESNKGTFAANRFYFRQKWGTDKIAHCRNDVFRNYYKHPWNNHDYSLDWWTIND